MFREVMLRILPKNVRQLSKLAYLAESRGSKLFALAGVIGASLGIYLTAREDAQAYGYVEENIAIPNYPWEHQKFWKSFDHAGIRRGFTVYNTIGIACHPIYHRNYRHLVNVAFTADEAKAIAAEHDDYESEPDEEGEVTNRPGELQDLFWKPYKNEKQARYSNNGSLPPDLSQIVRAKIGAENYIMALLTGYRDPPHGVKMGENMYYNVYFPGCQLAMPPPLATGAVEFDDGTEASISQMAKDVSEFLTWIAFMEHDERHLMGIKSFAAVSLVVLPLLWWKKFKYSLIKKRKVEFLRRTEGFQKKPHEDVLKPWYTQGKQK